MSKKIYRRLKKMIVGKFVCENSTGVHLGLIYLPNLYFWKDYGLLSEGKKNQLKRLKCSWYVFNDELVE